MIDLVDQFVRKSLDAAGAVVESEGEVLHVLLAPEAARALEVEEELRLTTVAACAGRGTADRGTLVDASLGSAFLDRLVGERLASGVVTALAVPGELPRPLPEDVPVLLNAVRRGDPERTRRAARYGMADVLLTLAADETRSAVAALCVRLEDGAPVPGFSLAGAYDVSRIGGGSGRCRGLDGAESAVFASSVQKWVEHCGLGAFAATLESIERRARRDLERLADYYRSLDAEMERAVRRARTDAEKARRRAKRELLPAELAARKEQLRERLRPRLSARLLAMRIIETEVDRFVVPVQRRASSGSVAVSRRAADGRVEGPSCAGCTQETLRMYLCDERLHALCPRCGREGKLDASRCPACSPSGVERAPASPGGEGRAPASPGGARLIVVSDATAAVLAPHP